MRRRGATPSAAVSGGRQWSPARTGRPGIYFLYAGINDLNTSGSAATTFAALAATWALARADGYGRIVAFTLPPWPGLNAEAEAARLALNESIRGASGYDVLLDLARLFPNNQAAPFGLDYAHLSLAGHTVLARQAWALLNGGPRFRHQVWLRRAYDQTVPAGVTTIVGGMLPEADFAGLLNLTAQQILCPEAGLVRVKARLLHSAIHADEKAHLYVYVNGSHRARLAYVRHAGTTRTLAGESLVSVAAGDVLDVRILCEDGDTTLYSEGAVELQYLGEVG